MLQQYNPVINFLVFICFTLRVFRKGVLIAYLCIMRCYTFLYSTITSSYTQLWSAHVALMYLLHACNPGIVVCLSLYT